MIATVSNKLSMARVAVFAVTLLAASFLPAIDASALTVEEKFEAMEKEIASLRRTVDALQEDRYAGTYTSCDMP